MTDHHELPAPARPAGLDALLDHVAAGLPVNERRDNTCSVPNACDAETGEPCDKHEAEQEAADYADPDPRTPADGHCCPGVCQGCACCGDRCTHESYNACPGCGLIDPNGEHDSTCEVADEEQSNTLRDELGEALVDAGGVPDTFPVQVNAQAGVLADAVLPIARRLRTVEQSDRIAVALAQAEQEIRRLHAELAARPTRAATLREGAQIADRCAEQYDDLDAMKAAGIIGPHTMAGAISTELRAQAIAAEQQAARPRIEVDLVQPAEPAPIEAPVAVPTVVPCAHGYGLMRDSCPGCDAEQDRPHHADPVTIRPEYAKRDMRRCRRCSLVPSHAIHRAAK